MANVAMTSDLEEVLRPFHQRAAEAEERLAKLELLSESKKGYSIEEALQLKDLQTKLDSAEAEKIEALKEVQKLQADNAKLQYRILHLIRAVQDADKVKVSCHENST
ncbi:hypothetical protein EJ110_NYTH07384 [Nymphaea thermarum]|nr:hypothetical protein EJ110_NYTH07384 [Nymphaea thermarum]